jgi:hypothetical protein
VFLQGFHHLLGEGEYLLNLVRGYVGVAVISGLIAIAEGSA